MYDNICKYLAENFQADLATWLLGSPVELTELSPTELSNEPIRADSLILLQSENLILHIEFQTNGNKNRFFGYFYGNPGSKSLKALLCRHFIENMEIIVYNPCPVRVLLSSILNHHKRDARA